MLRTLGIPRSKESGAISSSFLFSSYPCSTDFHKTWVTGSGRSCFWSTQRLNTFPPSLCELRQTTTISLFSFLPGRRVLAVTWDEGKHTCSTRLHKSEFKELHYSSWKQTVCIPCLDPLCMERWLGFPWWNENFNCLDSHPLPPNLKPSAVLVGVLFLLMFVCFAFLVRSRC